MDQPYTIPQVTQIPTIGQISLAALVTGGFTGLVTLSASAALLIVTPDLRTYWPLALVAAPTIVASATAGYYGISWIRENTTRQWFYEEEYLDNEDLPEVRQPSDEQARSIIDAGYKILVLHYIKGQQSTRPECESVGIQQTHWNSVNTILQSMGIKHARNWNENIEPAKAFDMWQSIQIMPNGTAVMIPMPNGNEYKRINI